MNGTSDVRSHAFPRARPTGVKFMTQRKSETRDPVPSDALSRNTYEYLRWQTRDGSVHMDFDTHEYLRVWVVERKGWEPEGSTTHEYDLSFPGLVWVRERAVSVGLCGSGFLVQLKGGADSWYPLGNCCLVSDRRKGGR